MQPYQVVEAVALGPGRLTGVDEQARVVQHVERVGGVRAQYRIGHRPAELPPGVQSQQPVEVGGPGRQPLVGEVQRRPHIVVAVDRQRLQPVVFLGQRPDHRGDAVPGARRQPGPGDTHRERQPRTQID
ncbi:hypothetical protein R6M67_21365, partial [Streptomyces sp. Wh19]